MIDEMQKKSYKPLKMFKIQTKCEEKFSSAKKVNKKY